MNFPFAVLICLSTTRTSGSPWGRRRKEGRVPPLAAAARAAPWLGQVHAPPRQSKQIATDSNLTNASAFPDAAHPLILPLSWFSSCPTSLALWSRTSFHHHSKLSLSPSYLEPRLAVSESCESRRARRPFPTASRRWSTPTRDTKRISEWKEKNETKEGYTT